MAHMVTCTICGQRFDRDTHEYAVMGSRRYAHADCMLREVEKNPNYQKKEIINPLDDVVCIYCKKPMHRTKDPCVMVSNGKYAHKTCAELESTRELTDEEKLNNYIKQLFKVEFVPPGIQKQIKNYINDYNFTHSGILKCLKYFCEVKGRKINGQTIGIVPYEYKNAYNYYYSIWLAQENSKNLDIEQFVPKKVEIVIPSPQTKPRKRQLFTFLDDEEVKNGQ